MLLEGKKVIDTDVLVATSNGNILSYESSVALGLFSVNPTVHSTTATPIDNAASSHAAAGVEAKFPQLFTGIEKIKQKPVHLHKALSVVHKQQKH